MRLIEKRGNYAMLLLGDLAVDDRETKTNLHYADYLLQIDRHSSLDMAQG